MELFKHFIELEKKKFGCKNVILAPDLYVEISLPNNIFKEVEIFTDICIIIATYSIRTEVIEIHSLSDVAKFKNINANNNVSVTERPKPVNEIDLKASERDLNIILKAVKKVKGMKDYEPFELIKQDDLIDHINPDGKKISQSKLSRMFTERKDCHIINIKKNPELYKELVQSISTFRNMMRGYDLQFIS